MSNSKEADKRINNQLIFSFVAIMLVLAAILIIVVVNQPPRSTSGGITLSEATPYMAPEIQGISAWINSGGETLEELRGKVVIIDFWTYSCINCIRTFPVLNEWYDKYNEYGLEIIGVHAPEFAFEQKLENVQAAVAEFGIKYPVALDNSFQTWQAYENRFWPAKYFINHEGKVVHTHFGEGEDAESEEVIRHLLAEAGYEVPSIEMGEYSDPPISSKQSPETYLGYSRYSGLANFSSVKKDQFADYTLKTDIATDSWSLGGSWMIGNESSISGENARLAYMFAAKDIYLVMGSVDGTSRKVTVKVDGELVSELEVGGSDVNSNGQVTVTEPKLYRLVDMGEFAEGRLLELEFEAGVEANAFTFGS